MLPGERDIVMQQERYRDLLLEAEHERLIRLAGNLQPNRRRWLAGVPNLIGLAVMRMGVHLVKRGLKRPRCSLTSLWKSERRCG